MLDEWVYTSPDPGNSPVLFARDSAVAPELLARYPARVKWLLLCGRFCELSTLSGSDPR